MEREQRSARAWRHIRRGRGCRMWFCGRDPDPVEQRRAITVHVLCVCTENTHARTGAFLLKSVERVGSAVVDGVAVVPAPMRGASVGPCGSCGRAPDPAEQRRTIAVRVLARRGDAVCAAASTYLRVDVRRMTRPPGRTPSDLHLACVRTGDSNCVGWVTPRSRSHPLELAKRSNKGCARYWVVLRVCVV